jgi:hypothetical protein
VATGSLALSRLDVELLRFLTRFILGRSWHLTVWTGASPHTVTKHMTRLASAGLVRSRMVPVDLRGPDGKVRPTQCSVWEVTAAGARAAGLWAVPGTDGQTLSMTWRRMSDTMTNHVIAASDLACWYRVFACQVTAEREILSLERESKIAPDRLVSSHWSVTPLYGTGIHAPDLGVVDPAGKPWAIEIERAIKSVDEYRKVIEAYRAAHLGQVWHILRTPTQHRLLKACEQLGITWAPQTDGGALVSTDGQVRFQAWRPGRSHITKPQDWPRQVPRWIAPAGFPVPAVLPDLTLSWRMGTPLDVHSNDYDPDGCGRVVRFTLPGTPEDDEDEPRRKPRRKRAEGHQDDESKGAA